MRVAGIDLGTNTILMLIADVDNQGTILPIEDYHSIARLGEGLNLTGEISTAALDRTISILSDYKNYIELHNVDKVFCVGTSALRDASNSKEVIDKIKERTGFSVEVINGEFEAYLSFLGTVENNKYSVVFDIGGGSTEIIAGENQNIIFRKSFDFGVVKFTEKYISNHPPSQVTIKTIKKELLDIFSSVGKDIVKGTIYAVAGTPTTIAAVVQGLQQYDRSKVDNYPLSLLEIRRAKEMFLSLSIEEIVRKLYVPPLRADVITVGAIILETFCEFFDLDNVIVSDKGLRYGIVKYYSQSNFSF
ncbi:MAG: Ppx/GppA family phosphatase [Ignavibacteria bacterium]|nr:Ppx/GppA family phosphatase [Ignavibacteria bacterium]